ncbi:hypothetical protein [Rickettsia endosymbiont of Gonocerus acuteangulatus]|uniref:hypothetical protein n=1 Tax=Rickettsia endosymbiont of Gonocerus acuteangulatus TaxID=3066266 RepID=UPI0031334266
MLLLGLENIQYVIPAEVEIQHKAREIELLILKFCYFKISNYWIPAFAGMAYSISH